MSRVAGVALELCRSCTAPGLESPFDRTDPGMGLSCGCIDPALDLGLFSDCTDPAPDMGLFSDCTDTGWDLACDSIIDPGSDWAYGTDLGMD